MVEVLTKNINGGPPTLFPAISPHSTESIMSDKGGVGYGSIPDVENAAPPEAEPSLMAKFIAEVIGTTTLVQIGCGGICASFYIAGLGFTWMIPVVWILAGTVGVYVSAGSSGGHLNPAVTLAFALVRPGDFEMKLLPWYWLAQIIGGILAGIINLIIYCTSISVYEGTLGVTRGEADSIQSAVGFGDYWSLSPGVANSFHAFVMEAIGTAFLLFVIFAITNPKNKSFPGAAVAPMVGVAIGCMIALMGTLTGAGINPARDMGPRLVTRCAGWGSASMTNWWPYIVGPLVGGPIGAAIADFLLFKF